MGKCNHVPQMRSDEIVVLRQGGIIHACGYICSKCGQSVYPLGSILPDERLTEEEKEILRN